VNSETTAGAYPQPVGLLLSIGKPLADDWCDFASMGITAEHIPDLIRLALDEQLYHGPENTPEFWAPVHAWRALGQLRAVQAVAPLLTLLQRIDEFGDDWIQEDVPLALAGIGAPVIEPTANYLADTGKGEWARIAAAKTLKEIGCAFPDLRGECVAKLAAQLEIFSGQSECLNAFLVSPLWDLHAVEAMPVIGRAYAAGCVDESVTGDVEDVQIHFGLKTEREHPRKVHQFFDLGERIARMRDENAALELENAALREQLLGPVPKPYVAPPKVGRNDPCPCGSGKKFKKCCGA
jgi:hypothetical protein